MTCTAPEATNAKRVPGAPFFFLSFFSLFTLFFFAIYSKASSFPVSLLRLHISISRHLQFFYSSQEHVVGSQSPQTPLLYDNERL